MRLGIDLLREGARPVRSSRSGHASWRHGERSPRSVAHSHWPCSSAAERAQLEQHSHSISSTCVPRRRRSPRTERTDRCSPPAGAEDHDGAQSRPHFAGAHLGVPLSPGGARRRHAGVRRHGRPRRQQQHRGDDEGPAALPAANRGARLGAPGPQPSRRRRLRREPGGVRWPAARRASRPPSVRP